MIELLSNPKISVIVPVYKVEQYLHKCVDSILAQTYTNLEVILVDDGSPDACPAICNEYAAKDSRVKVIHKENGGLSSARNAGLDICSGEYICFVDSDDYIEQNMYEIMLNMTLSNHADLCICSCFDEYENGTFPPDVEPSVLKDEHLSQAEVFRNMTESGGGVYAGVCNKLYPAALFSSQRFEIGRIHEDEFMAHHIIGQCQTVATINDYLYHYVHRAGSICQTDYSVKNLDAAWALYDRYKYFKEHGYPYEARRTWQASYGFLVTGLSKLPLKENRSAFAPLIKKIAFQSYVDLRTVKIMLIVAKKWLQETF